MQTYQDKVNGLLGLAAKAGKIVCGADAVQEAILNKKIFIVIIANDSSIATKEKFLRIAEQNGIKGFEFGTIDENSKMIGKKNKAIIAVKDKNFSEAICRILIGGDTIGQN